MTTETQRHRVSKTLTVSAGRDEIFQGGHDIIVRRDDAASSVEHRGNNRARRVLFARSRFLCASVPLWPSPLVAAAGCAWTKFESVNKILVSERLEAR